jgi:hypothetical protein
MNTNTYLSHSYHTSTKLTITHTYTIHNFSYYITNVPNSIYSMALVITLASTLNQCEIVITPNTIQWTNNIIRKLTQLPHPPQFTPHILQNFCDNNPDLINPSNIVHDKLYSFITENQSTLELLQLTFPYLLGTLLIEFLKCLQHIPNFTHPIQIQNSPSIIPYQNPHTIINSYLINYGQNAYFLTFWTFI